MRTSALEFKPKLAASYRVRRNRVIYIAKRCRFLRARCAAVAGTYFVTAFLALLPRDDSIDDRPAFSRAGYLLRYEVNFLYRRNRRTNAALFGLEPCRVAREKTPGHGRSARAGRSRAADKTPCPAHDASR